MVRRGACRGRVALSPSAAAYSATASAWERGPERIYDRLAEQLVERSPVPLRGGRILDVGAGTGAASRAVLAAGAASVVAVDAAFGMLAHRAPGRPPAVAGDALALPFATASFGAAVSAFSLNHLADPAAGLREMARVTRPGGAVLAAVYAADDDHPVKDAVEASLLAHGWVRDPWYESLRTGPVTLLGTGDGCADAGRAAGLDPAIVAVRVPFPDLNGPDLVAWRLGLAHHAPFVAGLSADEREVVVADAVARLGDAPPLVRSILVLRAVSP